MSIFVMLIFVQWMVILVLRNCLLWFKLKRVRAAPESSLKRGSFDRISNSQEFWNIEMGHLIRNIGIGQMRFWAEESTFRHQIFDFRDLGVEKKKSNSWEKIQKVIYKVLLKDLMGLIQNVIQKVMSCKYLSFGLWAEWEWKLSFH